jgi:hypothetical protein
LEYAFLKLDKAFLKNSTATEEETAASTARVQRRSGYFATEFAGSSSYQMFAALTINCKSYVLYMLTAASYLAIPYVVVAVTL